MPRSNPIRRYHELSRMDPAEAYERETECDVWDPEYGECRQLIDWDASRPSEPEDMEYWQDMQDHQEED